MSGEPNRAEDVYGIICGDLGMGEGLKPGGLPHSDSEKNDFANDLDLSSETSQLGLKPEALSCKCTKCGDESLSKKSQPCVHCNYRSPSRKKSKSNGSDCCDHENSRHELQSSTEVIEEEFPSYADVPLGTSLRQQKKLFEQNLGNILRNHTNNQPAVLMVSTNSDKCLKDGKSCRRERGSLSSGEIEKKLVDAVTEVEELKIELETCRRRLDAKYRAIAILKRQAEEAREEVEDNTHMSKEYHSILAKKKNESSTLKESSLLSSYQLDNLEVLVPYTLVEQVEEHTDITEQQNKIFNIKEIDEDYCRVCQENAVLMSTLESRSDELRRSNARNMALCRERDEILALMDVKEMLKYEKSKSQSSEDAYGSFSATELAVLGACRCRGSDPQPCGCAHAAASLKRDITKHREEIDLQKQRTEETYLTVDAYRKAFEEQLSKNKVLSVKLSELCVPAVPKAVKAKAALKWLISVLNDEEMESSSVNGMTPSRMYSEGIPDLKNTVLSPQEIITLLTEMIHEKNETLAHQKLAAQVLASKNKDLEHQLSAIKDEDVFK